MKKDLNRVWIWPDASPPAGASIWPKMVGYLTGYGQSHYACYPGTYFCPHLVTRGKGTIRTDQGTFAVGPGDMFTIWPGERLEYFEDPADPWEYYWIHLEGPDTWGYLQACGFDADRLNTQPRDRHAVRRIVLQIYQTYQAYRPADRMRIVAWLYELAACSAAVGDEPAAGTTSREMLVTQAKTLAETVLHTGANVSELARMLGVCRTTLFRAFVQCCGQTPMEYLEQLRIERAKRILRTGDQKLAVVARAAGFAGEKYFLRRFRQETGMTPSQYRKS